MRASGVDQPQYRGDAVTANGYADTPLLTPRGVELLALAAAGYTNQEIAARLCVTRQTVKNLLTITYAKLGVHTRVAAINQARRRGYHL